jgi:hypothetical protein
MGCRRLSSRESMSFGKESYKYYIYIRRKPAMSRSFGTSTLRPGARVCREPTFTRRSHSTRSIGRLNFAMLTTCDVVPAVTMASCLPTKNLKGRAYLPLAHIGIVQRVFQTERRVPLAFHSKPSVHVPGPPSRI